MLAALVSVAATARADPLPIRMEYARGSGAEACPDEEAIRIAVVGELLADPFTEDATTVASVRIDGAPVGLEARVVLRGPDGASRGSRTLSSEARDCAVLARAVALAIAMAVDPGRFLGATEPEPREPTEPPTDVLPPAPPPPSAPVATEVPRPVRPTPAGAPLSAATHVTAALAVGTVPAPTPGLGLGARLLSGRWSIDLEARFDLPASTSAPGGGRVSGSLLALGVSPCLRRPMFFVTVAGCARAATGLLFGSSEAVGQPGSDQSAWLGVGLRASAEAMLSERLGVLLVVDGLYNVIRTRLRIDGEAAWVAPPFAISPGAAVAVHFP